MKHEVVVERLRLAAMFADRSGIKSFHTGAIIYGRSGLPVGDGWSHYSSLQFTRYRSIHAELHALIRSYPPDIEKGLIYIATKSAKSGNVTLSKPCDVCMDLLSDTGLRGAVYTTGPTDSDWDFILF